MAAGTFKVGAIVGKGGRVGNLEATWRGVNQACGLILAKSAQLLCKIQNSPKLFP